MPEPASSPPTVFVSYRRQDASGEAGRLCDRLEQAFGPGRVFFDVESIVPGADFHRELERALRSCTVFLPIIGQRWLTVANERGVRRLDDPEDFVRVEIAASLARDDIIMIPVLVQEAGVPRVEELPPDLQKLVRRQFFRLTHEQFVSDVRRLIQAIERAHAARPAEVPPAPPIEPPAEAVPAPAPIDERVVDPMAPQRADPAPAAAKPVVSAPAQGVSPETMATILKVGAWIVGIVLFVYFLGGRTLDALGWVAKLYSSAVDRTVLAIGQGLANVLPVSDATRATIPEGISMIMKPAPVKFLLLLGLGTLLGSILSAFEKRRR